MTVIETGVSYYGPTYVEHARRDFQEMRDHHCTAVVLALAEFERMRLVQVSPDGGTLSTTAFAPKLGKLHTDGAATFPSELAPVT